VANEERDRLLATIESIEDTRIILWAFQYMTDVAHNKVVLAQDVVLRAERFGDQDEINKAVHRLAQANELSAFAGAFYDLMQALIVDGRLSPSLLKAVKTIK
jgi:hypothetical protein